MSHYKPTSTLQVFKKGASVNFDIDSCWLHCFAVETICTDLHWPTLEEVACDFKWRERIQLLLLL